MDLDLRKTLQDELKQIKCSFNESLEAIEKRLFSKIDHLYSELASIKENQKDLRAECSTLKKENMDLRLELDRVEQASHTKKFVLGGEMITEFVNASKDTLRDSSELFLNKKLGIDIGQFNVTHATRLGARTEGKPDKRPILLEVDDTFTRTQAFRAVISKKSRSLYISEYLTQRRRGLMNSLLSLKKAHPSQITRVFSRQGIVQIQLKNSDLPTKINDQGDLDRCARKIISNL